MWSSFGCYAFSLACLILVGAVQLGTPLGPAHEKLIKRLVLVPALLGTLVILMYWQVSLLGRMLSVAVFAWMLWDIFRLRDQAEIDKRTDQGIAKFLDLRARLRAVQSRGKK